MPDKRHRNVVSLVFYELSQTRSINKLRDQDNTVDFCCNITPVLDILELDDGWAQQRVSFIDLCAPKFLTVRTM